MRRRPPLGYCHPHVGLRGKTGPHPEVPFSRAHGFVPLEVTLQRRLDERLASVRILGGRCDGGRTGLHHITAKTGADCPPW